MKVNRVLITLQIRRTPQINPFTFSKASHNHTSTQELGTNTSSILVTVAREPFELVFKSGDLFTASFGEPLAHCVSADCAYGAGIAKQFRERYGVYKVKQQNKQKGECAVTYETDRIVFNLITKNQAHDRPIYGDFESSLTALKEWCVPNSVKSISVPRLGCGLDKLDYQTVLKIICRVFKGIEMTITIYTL
ncbi:MAG: macro domain-containing protein [Brevinema sp.]